MKKRMLDYLRLMEETDFDSMPPEKLQEAKKDLLLQIGFFQHERLIHLIVTVLFALLTFMALGLALTGDNVYTFILVGALLILLIPYIKHYYLLENGTQKLYTYYDKILEIEKTE